jgi:hypothetical protein
MPLNTYNDLLAGLQAWLEDDDAEFQGSIPDVIDLAEKRLVRDLGLQLFRRVDSTTTMTASVNTATKPTIASPDLLITTKQMWLTGGAIPAGEFRFPAQRDVSYCRWHASGSTDAEPEFWAELDETTWFFSPAPDATYTVNISYLSRPDRLTVANQTNWLSDNVYDILFKAGLAEAEKFLKADERVLVWDKDYLENMPQVRRELYQQFGNQFDRLGATPLPAQPRSLTI